MQCYESSFALVLCDATPHAYALSSDQESTAWSLDQTTVSILPTLPSVLITLLTHVSQHCDVKMGESEEFCQKM